MIIIYIISGLIGIIVILLFIALLRTFRIKDKNIGLSPLPRQKQKEEIYAKGLSKMIQVKTLSYNKDQNNIEPFNILKDTMRSLFPHVFNLCEYQEFDDGTMLLKWKGVSSEKPMILMAHQDIVPANNSDWTYEPFSGTITEHEIHGRGTLDTKGTLYGFFKAIEELIEEGFTPAQDIYLSSSSDEETSGSGASKVVSYLQRNNIKPYLVLDEGGAVVDGALPFVHKPMALIGVLEKGYANFKFTAKSKGGHSSTPPKNTPIARLSAFVHEVETNFPLKTKMIPEVEQIFTASAPSMSFSMRYLFGNMWLFKPLLTFLLPKISPFGRALLSTSIAFTMQEGSAAENVIPSEAYVLANLRIHPIQNIQESYNVLQKIAKKYDIEVEISGDREASLISRTDNDMYHYLSKIIARNFPDVIVTPYVMLGSSDCRFFSEISESAYRFSPTRMTNEEVGKIHGKNESITKSALVEAVHFYKDLIQNYE